MSELDNRLVEIDRRLRQIQKELQPDLDPRPSRSAAVEPQPPIPEPEPPEPPEPPERTEPPEPQPPEPEPPEPEPPEPEPEPQAAPAPPAAEPEAARADGELRGRQGPLAALLARSRRSREPQPQAPPPSPPTEQVPPPETYPLDQILALSQLHTRLLISMQELLDGYRYVLTQLPRAPSGADPASDRELTLSVGPFASVEDVRSFESALAALPNVRAVSVRGYEGTDRAVVDVQLYEPTP